MSHLEALRFAIAAIAIRALGSATDLTRDDIATALERAADDLRYEREIDAPLPPKRHRR